MKLLIDVNLINANICNSPNFNKGVFLFSLMKEQVINPVMPHDGFGSSQV
ncbi:hypothetical protein MtrunA17_Chr2g0314551 [Medicago truncatula]|uniref:Uncharacterized protein n=1 Tax=Medicago truncatula TaxID=3880 RepID=A0A396J983_MEDTR|nr:hypothetical protein MtrunA17_Chr2g0314551 [Medicago truncatula]